MIIAELSPLDPKKKLSALKKKWGTNKADAYVRIVWMRAGDNYVRYCFDGAHFLFCTSNRQIRCKGDGRDFS